MKNYALLLFIFITGTLTYSQVVPIASVRDNDANGVPIHLGETFTVSGIVTSSSQFGSSGPGSIEDETAGISVFGSDFSGQVNIGDSVTITSVISQFNGLTEFDFTQSGSVLINNGSGHETEPVIVTVEEILNQEWNGFEEFEGRLVRVNNVTFLQSGTFAGGTNYDITDGTGTVEVRIDNDVSTIIGTPIPASAIDIIGVLGQFDFSPPYSSGYQVLPRFIEDLVYDGTPLILNPVFAADITTTSFTVYFNTARNGNSQVKYGLTPDLEIDSVVIDNDTTFHVVPVTGLEPSTLYYFRAYSTNDVGTSESSLYSVSTASANPTIGAINVYFNFSIDTTIAVPGNNALGNVDFKQKLIERINAANYSIDLALYSFFDMPDIADALVVAKQRDVKIRVVYHNRTTQNSMQTLINAGIPYIKRTDSEGLMHNKFVIFDARDTVETNDWVWTGSWNVTGNEINWKNNVVEVNDPTLASAYTTEFEEMWGSSDDTPDPGNAKFGGNKMDNTPHAFSIGGRDVSMYFSPSDGTTNKIINAVNTADYSIYMALYTFTRDDISSAIIARSIVGVSDIRGLIDQVNAQGSEFTTLQPYAEMLSNNGSTMHHKYSIFDPQYENSDPIVETGSHNWTTAAEQDNDENTLIIHDYLIANQYLQEYKKRYSEDGGTGTFIVPVGVDEDFEISKFSYQLYQNFPNPFNPVTTIRFEVPYRQHVELSIYDILGRKVKTLFDDMAPGGIIAVDFNAENLASGLYFYKIKADNFVASKKLVLLK